MGVRGIATLQMPCECSVEPSIQHPNPSPPQNLCQVGRKNTLNTLGGGGAMCKVTMLKKHTTDHYTP